MRDATRAPQHNVRLQLTYLDFDQGEESQASRKTSAMMRRALEPVPQDFSAPAAAA